MPLTTPNFVAGGNISPCCPVYPTTFTSGANTTATCVKQATDATVPMLGIASPATDYPPINDSAHVTVSSYAAVAGEPVRIFGVGEVCHAIVGTGGVTIGKMLIAATNGVTDASASVGQQYVVALALETSTVVGSKVLVQVMPGVINTATS